MNRGDRGTRERPGPDARCEAGQAIDFRTYTGLDHVGLVRADSPLIGDLFEWTADRFAAVQAAAACGPGAADVGLSPPSDPR